MGGVLDVAGTVVTIVLLGLLLGLLLSLLLAPLDSPSGWAGWVRRDAAAPGPGPPAGGPGPSRNGGRPSRALRPW